MLEQAIREELAKKVLLRTTRCEGLRKYQMSASPSSLSNQCRQVGALLAVRARHSSSFEGARKFYNTTLSDFTCQYHPCADLLTGRSICYSDSAHRCLGCCPAAQEGRVLHYAADHAADRAADSLDLAASLPFLQHQDHYPSIRTGRSGMAPRAVGSAEGCQSARPFRSPVL